MKKCIYILGNPTVEKDSLGVKLLPRLKQTFPLFEFVHLDPTELDSVKDNSIFIDVVVGLPATKLFTGLDSFSAPPRFTVHDYDLYLHLALLRKVGKIKRFTIIGLPAKGDVKTILQDVTSILSSSMKP